MAILDFLWGSRKKRALAKRLLGEIADPFGRLHAMIDTEGRAQIGDGFEDLRIGFVDCRILRTEELKDFPAGDRDALARLVAELLPRIAPLHAEIGQAFGRVLDEWPYGGLAEAAARGGLTALERLQTRDGPKTVQDRLFRLALFFDVDTACRDIGGELKHIAEAPSLFW